MIKIILGGEDWPTEIRSSFVLVSNFKSIWYQHIVLQKGNGKYFIQRFNGDKTNDD